MNTTPQRAYLDMGQRTAAYGELARECAEWKDLAGERQAACLELERERDAWQERAEERNTEVHRLRATAMLALRIENVDYWRKILETIAGGGTS